MNIEALIDLRFKERNVEFQKNIVTLQRNMASKGMLNSGITIQNGHELLIAELKGSSETILSCFADSLVGQKSHNIFADFKSRSLLALSERKAFLESFYNNLMNTVISGLSNKSAIQGFLDLSSSYELVEKELEISILKLIQSYVASLGKTLLERVQNQFLNRPLVVIAIITMSTVSIVLAFATHFITNCRS